MEVGVTMYVLSISSLSEVQMVLKLWTGISAGPVGAVLVSKFTIRIRKLFKKRRFVVHKPDIGSSNVL